MWAANCRQVIFFVRDHFASETVRKYVRRRLGNWDQNTLERKSKSHTSLKGGHRQLVNLKHK